MKTGGLLAALALALVACDRGYEPVQQPLSCVDVSHRAIYGCVQRWGTGSTLGASRSVFAALGYEPVGELAGGPYICRAEISGNIGTSPETPTAPAPVLVGIVGAVDRDDPGIEIIDEDAAAAAWGEARFAAYRNDLYVRVIASPRSRWGLACEPDAAP